jgi:hypothetical protein
MKLFTSSYQFSTAQSSLPMFSILVLISIGIVIIWESVLTQPFFALAQNGGPKSVSHVMDLSHKFSLDYNSTNMYPTKDGPRWNLTVFTKAAPHTQPIKNVSYIAYPGFPTPNGADRETRNNTQDQFKIEWDGLYGGINITTTVNFKDGKNIPYPGNPLRVLLPCPPNDCYVKLNVFPKIRLVNDRMIIEVAGNATGQNGSKITTIQIDWGDGKQEPSASSNTPASSYKRLAFRPHLYSTLGSYKINMTVSTDKNVDSRYTITTTSLLFERYLPKNLPVRISDAANAILDISTTSDTIQSDTPITFQVNGKLSNLTGAPIGKQPIHITMFSNKTHDIHLPITDTLPNGEYSAPIDSNTLGVGTYKIVAQPEGQKYLGFNVTKDLIVIPRPLTFDQFIQYLSIIVGIGVAIIGGIVKVPEYISGKKQATKLRDCIRDINNVYNKFKEKLNPLQTDKDQYWKDLESLRSNFMDLLASRNIIEDQYKMLDEMISIYSNKVK